MWRNDQSEFIKMCSHTQVSVLHNHLCNLVEVVGIEPGAKFLDEFDAKSFTSLGLTHFP